MNLIYKVFKVLFYICRALSEQAGEFGKAALFALGSRKAHNVPTCARCGRVWVQGHNGPCACGSRYINA